MEQIEIDRQEAEPIAERLKSLACVECVRGWLKTYEGETGPIADIIYRGTLGLITSELQERLLGEVKAVQQGDEG